MNYLIVSPIGLSFFLVPRLGKIKDVEKVYFCCLDSSMKELGKHMSEEEGWEKLELVKDPYVALKKAPQSSFIIFIDDVGCGDLGDHLRKEGYRVIGGSSLIDRLEDDRDFATKLMGKIMDVPETYTFESFEAGLGFLKGRDKKERFIFKPNDADVPKEYTYVSKDITDMVKAMQSFKSEWHYKESFQLQVFVPGKEVDFNAYFNGKEYIENSMFVYFENKPLCNDDIGPATGGAIAMQVSLGNKGIFWDILEKIKPVLIKGNYVGQIALNSIISEDNHKPHFLEFCARVGYPSFPMDITLVEDNGKSIHDLFVALAYGKNGKGLFPLKKPSVTISIFVPPAPNGKDMSITEGIPVKWSKEWDKYFFPYYIKRDEKKGIVLAGISSWVMQVTCADETVDGAVSMLYDTYMPTLELKDKIYRTDLGKSAKDRIKKIKEWGLIS